MGWMGESLKDDGKGKSCAKVREKKCGSPEPRGSTWTWEVALCLGDGDRSRRACGPRGGQVQEASCWLLIHHGGVASLLQGRWRGRGEWEGGRGLEEMVRQCRWPSSGPARERELGEIARFLAEVSAPRRPNEAHSGRRPEALGPWPRLRIC